MDLDEQPSPVPPPIQALVATEVRRQLDKELALLKETGSLAAKILGGALGVLLVIFTVFSLTTWDGIKDQAAQIVTTRTEELIQSSDSQTGVRRTLDDLVNRAIVSSSLSQIARGKSDDSYSREDVALSQGQWNRLRAWIKLEELPATDFADVLSVLNAQDEERKRVDANTILAEMLEPKGASEYTWMRRHPEKRDLILKEFKHEDLAPVAVAMASSPAEQRVLRIAAIKYLQEIQYQYALDTLLSLAKTNDAELTHASIIAAAAIHPDDSRLIALIRERMSSATTEHNYVTAARVLQSWRRNAQLQKDKSAVTELARDMLRYLIDHEAYFSLGQFANGEVGVAIQLPTTLTIMEFSGSLGRIAFFPLSDFENVKPYHLILTEAANAGDIKRLRKGFPVGDITDEDVLFRLSMSSNSILTTMIQGKAAKFTPSGSASEKVLLRSRTGRGAGIEVVVVDEQGARSRGELVGLSGGNFGFSVEAAPKE